MTSPEQGDKSDPLTKAQTKHRRRLWISRTLMALLFLSFLYGSYQLLGWLIAAVVPLTLGSTYYMQRKTGEASITDLHEEEPPLLLQNVVKSLSHDYGIEEPKIIVTNDGEVGRHLFVTKENGTHYLGTSTVYLDLVSGDALAADLAHEFEHLTNNDLYGGKLRAYSLEFFEHTAILIVSILATVAINILIWGNSPIVLHWSLPPFAILACTSLGFYLALKWESRESEWLADIGAMKHIGPDQLAKGFIEGQGIYGIPIIERIRDRVRVLFHSHPPTSKRLQFAGSVSDLSNDEFIETLDIEAIQENAEKYSEYTPDIDSEQ